MDLALPSLLHNDRSLSEVCQWRSCREIFEIERGKERERKCFFNYNVSKSPGERERVAASVRFPRNKFEATAQFEHYQTGIEGYANYC